SSKDDGLFTNAIQIIGNEIALLNTESGGSALFVAADDVLIEDNLIVVVPHKVLTYDLKAVHSLLKFARTARESYLSIIDSSYQASGGIQIAGGSELVTIRRNRIVGGSGNGLTLGNIPSEKGQKFPIFISELDTASKAFIDENAIPYVYNI